MKKKLLFIFPLLFLTAVLFLLIRNNSYTEKDLSFKGNSYIEGLRIVHKKNGNELWSLNAGRADISENEDKAKLTNIEMTTKDEVKVYAADGIYNLDNQDLGLGGNITVMAKDYTITTDSAEWDHSSEEIRTRGDVKIESGKFNVEGDGMTANSKQKVKILKNVKAIFYH